VDANPNCPACGGSGRDPEYTDVFNQRPCLRCWFGLDEPQRTAVIETTASQWVSAAPDDPATLRAQLAEARAEVERVTRERDEARAELAKTRDALRAMGEAVEAERAEARAELAAERARRDEKAEAVTAGVLDFWERMEWAESVANEAMAEGLAECERLRAERERWAAENRRWRDAVYAQLCAVMDEAARWKWWARLAVAAYVEAEGERDRAESFAEHMANEVDEMWHGYAGRVALFQAKRADDATARADAAEARARGSVDALRRIAAEYHEDRCPSDRGGACTCPVGVAQAALAAAEGGE
jgi:chromosome segregation ATPase